MRSSSWRAMPPIILLTLTGCVQHTFAPGPGMTAFDYEPQSAECRIFARSNSPGFGFSASGSPKFVAGSMVGAAIGAGIATAVANNHNYNDCMEAKGWRVVDDVKPPTAAAGITSAAAAATPPPQATIVTASAASSSVAPLPPAPVSSSRAFQVRAAVVDEARAVSLRMDAPRGVVLLDVIAGGAAASSGLLPGDVVLAFNGSPVLGIGDLTRDLDRIPGGGQAQVTIWRLDTERSLMLQL